MTKNQTVIIERVGNGYIVRPYLQDGVYPSTEITVFQDKGLARPSRDNQAIQDTLFGFLDLHFSDNEINYDREIRIIYD